MVQAGSLSLSLIDGQSSARHGGREEGYDGESVMVKTDGGACSW
jgi:hypothetical protein